MYFLLLAVLYPLSLLPLWLLYRLSDLAYLILYRGMGYRTDVVRSNLQHAFPEKSAVEIEAVMSRFYRSFCDQWIETVKLLTMRKASLKRRVKGDWSLLARLAASGKNTYLLTYHNFNWEWGNAAISAGDIPNFAGVYLPLSSTAFDRLMQRIRTRNGTLMISMKALKGGLQELTRRGPYCLGLLADQNPSVVEVADWIPFMNRDAPFFRGPEQMARRAKGAVVLLGCKKIRRGHYQATMDLLTEDASQLGPGVIVRGYVAFLENQLREQPENWLWSHRRWKHRRPEPIAPGG